MTFFHDQTAASCLQLCRAMGYEHPDMLRPSDIYRRFDQGLMHFDEIYTPLEIGQLMTTDLPQTYAADWQKASAEHFKIHNILMPILAQQEKDTVNI